MVNYGNEVYKQLCSTIWIIIVTVLNYRHIKQALTPISIAHNFSNKSRTIYMLTVVK